MVFVYYRTVTVTRTECFLSFFDFIGYVWIIISVHFPFVIIFFGVFRRVIFGLRPFYHCQRFINFLSFMNFFVFVLTSIVLVGSPLIYKKKNEEIENTLRRKKLAPACAPVSTIRRKKTEPNEMQQSS